MALTTYLVRAIPLLLIKKPIKNVYLLSFLHYIPYAVLAVMTFPGALFATGNIYTALFGIGVALILAFFKRPLIVVALGASGGVLLAEIFVEYLLPLII
jgi:branched-subunit amino acid transport protein